MKHILCCLLLVSFAFPVRTLGAEGDENWQAGFVLPPGLDGDAYALVSMGTNLYVGGRFQNAGGLVVNSVARWDGSNWYALDTGVNGVVYALAVQGTNLYVGGKFDRAGNVPAINLARWSGSEWQAIGDVQGLDENSAVAPGFGLQGPKVVTLLATTNQLVVGGNFRQAGGVFATNVAVWNGTNWSAYGAGLGSLGGQVQALAQFKGQLFAGGVFYNSGNSYLTNIARWTGTNWRAAGAGLRGPALDYWQSQTQFVGTVNSLAVQGKRLLAGGQINRSGGTRLVNLAAWNGARWRPVNRGVGTTGFVDTVESITVHGKHAFIAGSFKRAGTATATNIVRFDGRRWFRLGDGLGGPVKAVSVVGTNVYVGGSFGLAGNVSAAYIARWNWASNSWSALGEGVGNTLIENAITLAASDNLVFAAGPIHTAGTNQANNVAAWTGTNWLTLNPGLVGLPVASAVASGHYFVGGRFNLPSVKATNLAGWNGSNWFALPPLTDATGQPAIVYAVAGSSNRLFVAGNFIFAGDLAATNIAQWSGSNWINLPNAPVVTPLLRSLPMIADEQNLYVLHTATNSSGEPSEEIHLWNGLNWSVLGAPNGAGHIRSLSLFGGQVYVASVFDQAGDTDTTKLDRWIGNRWEAVNWPFGQLGHVPLLASSERYLYAGGPWENTASSSPGIARFDGSNWSGLGSGLIDNERLGDVETIVTSGNRVIVAGYFRTAGGKPSYRFAIWNEP